MKANIFSFIAGLIMISPMSIQAERESFTGITPTLEDVDMFEAGGNYYCYPWLVNEVPPLSSDPEGYKPFHLEHYGRHGSRWHIGDYNYDTPYRLLKRAHEDGKLTPLGEEVFENVCIIREEFKKGRDGELSDKGAKQHYGIGRRMALNFPEIFNPTTEVDAKSTVVIRCILSMQNSLKGIQSVVPSLKVKTDASQADMWYMNEYDRYADSVKKQANKEYLYPFYSRHDNNREYYKNIFTDLSYAAENIGDTLAHPLFSLLVNTQSHENQNWLLDRVFSIEEIRERWQERNANWFMIAGNSKMTDNLMPFTQANVLKNIIESADTAMMSKNTSANLRYGHDSVVLPLVCLLEIDNFGEEINDLELLDEKGWHDYKVIPMGANVQIVFYRPEQEDYEESEILLKVMLNESEVSLPLQSIKGPYYRWIDFKEYYNEKLINHDTRMNQLSAN